ncbi:MAG: metallopeptidase family protein [Deltaproteobacteria bacterium]|nr:metallopeptidase family protein [Deltaproteobacteria bacterium]
MSAISSTSLGMSRLEELVDEAHEALYDGRLDDAKRLLNDARRVDGRAIDVRLLEVDVLAADDLLDEAVSAAEEARDDHPRSMIIAFRLVTLLLDGFDDVASARPILEDLVRRLQKGEEPDTGGLASTAEEKADKAEAAVDFAVEVYLTLSDVRAADHDPRGALAAADLAVKLAPDDAMARVARAAALFDLCRVDDAEKIVAQAVDRDPRNADAWWLRGRIHTIRGDHDKADKAFERAIALDGERFQPPFRITEDRFAKVIEEAMAELPEVIRGAMKNLDVIVEDLPNVAVLLKSDPPLSPSAVGLFDPEPLAPNAGPGQPVRIFLYRKNLEVTCASEDEMVDEIGVTLLHEIGHHLGLDEEDLDARGLS